MASWLSQDEKMLQVTTPLEGDDALRLYEFSGVEGISRLFYFNLNLVGDSSVTISPEKIIGKPVTIQLNADRDTPRYFHGFVERFYPGAIVDSMRHYYALIMPWLGFLNHSSDCRIFQHKSVIDIAKLLFSEFGFSQYDTSGLNKTYSPREYCVQYNETALNFLERIFQEEGIFYFFKHENGKHTLMLADKATAFKTCADTVIFQTDSGTDKTLVSWQRQHTLYAGKYEQGDYNFETPDTTLHTQQQSAAKLPIAQKYGHYNYPGRYQNTGDGKTYTQQHFEANEIANNLIEGAGNYPSFTAAGKFALNSAPVTSDVGSYVLLSVNHYAADSSYLNSGGSQTYQNSFICLSSKINYQPAKTIPKPAMNGPQTALVVGYKGEEIYTDEYGRVRVQFHWDRKGKKDDFSSCWIRVAQPWAGNHYGMQFMPRIGQEVVVQFLNSDPDRPLITGSVYNADNLPPYSLPANQTQSGIKTCSSKGGSAADYNELKFEDAMGQEKISIQAQKDFEQLIKNNLTVNVNNQGTIQAQNSFEIKVASNSILINAEGIFINGAKVNINN